MIGQDAPPVEPDEKACPSCAEPVEAVAIKCKRCGERFTDAADSYDASVSASARGLHLCSACGLRFETASDIRIHRVRAHHASLPCVAALRSPSRVQQRPIRSKGVGTGNTSGRFSRSWNWLVERYSYQQVTGPRGSASDHALAIALALALAVLVVGLIWIGVNWLGLPKGGSGPAGLVLMLR